MDPPMVILKCSETSEMSSHTSYHSWYSCDCLKEDHSVEPSSLVHLVWVVSSDHIKASPYCSDHSQSYFVRDTLRFVVVRFYLLNVTKLVNWMCHPVRLWIQDHFELWKGV